MDVRTFSKNMTPLEQLTTTTSQKHLPSVSSQPEHPKRVGAVKAAMAYPENVGIKAMEIYFPSQVRIQLPIAPTLVSY